MGSNTDFLSEDEIAELRKEMEALIMEDGGSAAKSKEPLSEPIPKGQMLSDIIDEANSKSLSIEENGSYIKIAEDDMSAWLYLTVPGEGKEKYTMEEIMDFLKKNGITTGYHHSNLAAMIKKKVYEREIVVAKGQPAIEGKDGYYEYKFDPDQHRAPKVLPDGSVDYTSMSVLQNVRKDEVVAIYHHAEAGENGYDVKGRVLQTKKVKEAPPLRGQVVNSMDNPDVYLAQKDGKIEYKNGKIDIQSMHEINGDVTLITGKVEFYGDIVINGNVEAGVVIRAGRNIEIKGTVEAVNLFAGGDVILTKGIQGAQRAKISARGNIFADFIEHTVVVAGGNVQANTILNSRISSDGQVILTGNKGAIIGGYTHAMMGISATEIGNPAEVRTIVHVGSEKEVYTRLQTVKATETEQSTELQELSENLSDLLYKKKAANGKIPDIMESRIKNLEGRVKSLKKEIEENRVELEKCEAIIAKGKRSEIVINGNIYRGTVVCLAQIQMPIERSTCYMKYYQERGMIESSVIAYS